jgi:thiaminase/transcriptional activator TenA
VRHPFLKAVREGDPPAGSFESWLVQDYLFVLAGLGFQARLLVRAPRRDQGLLAAGLVALEDELGWFEEQASKLGLKLEAARRPANEEYCNFLAELDDEPYPAAITALWALERAYFDAWRGVAPGAPEYREFVEHWTTPEFAAYVDRLEEAVDAALAGASSAERERAEEAFARVARLEREFWQMALEKGESA